MVKGRGVLTRDCFCGKTPESLADRVLTKRQVCDTVHGVVVEEDARWGVANGWR